MAIAVANRNQHPGIVYDGPKTRSVVIPSKPRGPHSRYKTSHVVSRVERCRHSNLLKSKLTQLAVKVFALLTIPAISPHSRAKYCVHMS
jgi:hypothetical protein